MSTPTTTPSAAAPLMNRGLVAHLIGVTSWFLSVGLQFVLVPTVALVVLSVSPLELGIAQLVLLLPSIVLQMLGGALADRHDGRNLLIMLHLLATAPAMWLGFQIWNGSATFASILFYGLFMGTLTAFAMPTRDALLTRVAPNIQRGILVALLAQFVAQAVGFILAGGLALTAPVWAVLVAQAICLAAGAAGLMMMARQPPIKRDTDEPAPFMALREGWNAVAHSARLYPAVLAMASVGFCFLGVYLVVLPLITTEKFGGGQWEISITNLCFWGGTIITTIVLMSRRPIVRRGRAMCLSLMTGTAIMVAMSLVPNFAAMCVLCTVWGLSAGVMMTMSRTVVQTKAPEHLRARVLALYNTGFMGGAPVGALGMGAIVGWVGLDWSTFIPAGVMATFLLWLIIRTPIWRIR